MSRNFIAFFVLLCVLTRTASAQETGGLQFTLRPSSSEDAGNGITELVAHLSNTGTTLFEGSVELVPREPYRLLTRTVTNVQIAGGKELYLPVKLYTSGHALADSLYPVLALLKDGAGRVLARDMQVLSVPKVVNVTMFLTDDQLLIRDEQELTVPLHLTNGGNTTQSVTIIVKYPPDYRHRDYSFSRIVLPPFRDTILQYRTAISGEFYHKGDFDLKFTGLFGDGNLIGTTTARVAVARSVRRYHPPGNVPAAYDGTSNSMTLLARYINDPQENYELFGGSSITFGHSRLTYQLDANVWKNGQIDPVVRNTYVSYSYKNAGVTAGNINRSYDINLFGKGVAAQLKATPHHRMEAGYIVDGYNLLESRQPFTAQQGWSAWGHHEYADARLSVKTDIISNNPSYVRVSNQILTSEMTLVDGRNNRLQLSGGLGRTAALDGGGQQMGYSGGLNYNYQLRKFRFNTNNYASSGYYPGYRRGALILSERIDWQYRAKYRLWTGYNFYSFRPQQLTGTPLPVSRYRSGKAELGWDINPGKRLSYSVSVNYLEEGNSYNPLLPGDELTTIRSAHLAGTVNLSNPFARYFATLNVEGGGYRTSVTADQQFTHLKANLTASFRWLRLSAYYQQGYFQASEVLSYYRTPADRTYRQLTINPQLTKSLLKDRLKIDAGFAYNTNSRVVGSTLATFSLLYSITPRLSAIVNYNRFGYGNTGQNIYEAGFTYALPPAASDLFVTGSTLRVFVFRDRNGNGLFDIGEEPAARQTVLLNHTPFLTDAGGIATYRRLPDTTVSIQVADDREWYAADRSASPGRSAVNIALQRTATVGGQIRYIAGDYSYDIEQKRAGIVISLTGSEKTYRTRTDEQGHFTFYVPAGVYELHLDTGNLSDKVDYPEQGKTVIAVVDKPVNIPVALQIRGQKVQIKKFGPAPAGK